MKIRKETSPNGVFAVGNIFVEKYLDKISGEATKLYLQILYCFNVGENFYEPVIMKKLNIDKDAFEKAMEELKAIGLISYEKGQFLEISANEKIGVPNALMASFAGYVGGDVSDEKSKEFSDVVKQINKEFFAGRMSNRWFTFAEKCLREYGFEPETIYLLFVTCDKFKDKHTSGYDAYVNKVAENWRIENIKTAEDVAKRSEEWEKSGEYIRFVEKKLNFARPFTEAERDTILSWNAKQISEDMLSVVLDDTGKVSALTIARINNEITKWVEAGVKTKEDAIKFRETQKQAKTAESKQKQTTKSQQNTQVHFDNERNYSDDELDALMNRDKKNGGNA